MKGYYYKDHPKSCKREDIWGQVKRTVNGKPVSQEQINMIVEAINRNLELSTDDILLDLCCGNGGLSTLCFDRCKAGLGVDFSKYLIGVADEFFSSHSQVYQHVNDVVIYANEESNPERFTVAMCYGSFQYLPKNDAKQLLYLLRERFICLRKLFIGNLPNKDKMADFFGEGKYISGIENDSGSPIGIWRTKKEFYKLATSVGWDVDFSTMPAEYFAAKYRYDATLTPR